MFPRAQGGRDRVESGHHVAGDLQHGVVLVADGHRCGVEMDDRQSAFGVPNLWIVLDRVEADREHEVGGLEQSIARLIAKQAHAADEVFG